MKLIRLPNRRKMKTVQYFNLELIIPENIKYISVDQEGEIVLWFAVHEPYVRMYSWGVDDWVGEASDYDVGKVDLEGMDWRDTLVELEYEEVNDDF